MMIPSTDNPQLSKSRGNYDDDGDNDGLCATLIEEGTRAMAAAIEGDKMTESENDSQLSQSSHCIRGGQPLHLKKYYFSWKNVVRYYRPKRAVLLLFSPDICCYEVLVLQYIRENARVSDILQHIIPNCQDNFLRKQSYRGVLVATTETLLTPEKSLARHCGNRNSILVAVPDNPQTLVDCTRNAIQLLSDPVMEYVLAFHGFHAKGWITKRKQRYQFLVG